MTDDLYPTAIHESGHTVIAELLGRNPECLTIEPTEETTGHLRYRRTYCSPLDTWHDLIVTFGGHVAQGLMAKDMVSDDYLNSYGALRWPYSDEEITDGAQIWASLQEHSEGEQQRQTWFELAFAQTQRILSNRAVWRSVESLAWRLMEARTLNNRGDIGDVIRAALGRSKWNQWRYWIQMSVRYASPPQSWIDSREEYRAIGIALARTKERLRNDR